MNPNAISLAKARAELRRLEGLRHVARFQVMDYEQKIAACKAAIDVILNTPEPVHTTKTDQNAS